MLDHNNRSLEFHAAALAALALHSKVCEEKELLSLRPSVHTNQVTTLGKPLGLHRSGLLQSRQGRNGDPNSAPAAEKETRGPLHVSTLHGEHFLAFTEHICQKPL